MFGRYKNSLRAITLHIRCLPLNAAGADGARVWAQMLSPMHRLREFLRTVTPLCVGSEWADATKGALVDPLGTHFRKVADT